MTWQDLLNEGKIEQRQTSRAELNELREAVARDLADAEVEYLSADRQFTTAYNAALLSAKMVIRCSGYRVRGHGAHYITFECLKLALFGFVLPESEGVVHCHNPFLNRSLISFWLFANWVHPVR